MCGALIGGNGGDQVRHTTWHTLLATLLPPGGQGRKDDPPSDR
jgi:hypothetical protein